MDTLGERENVWNLEIVRKEILLDTLFCFLSTSLDLFHISYCRVTLLIHSAFMVLFAVHNLGQTFIFLVPISWYSLF